MRSCDPYGPIRELHFYRTSLKPSDTIVDPELFQSYPYGYTRAYLDDVDTENVDTVLNL